MASTPSPILRVLSRAASGAIQLSPFLPTYFHLLVSALFPIYTGAHASLTRPSSAARPEKKKSEKSLKKDDESDDEDEDVVVQKMEGLSPSDAIMFPLMAGATLTILYFVIKWLKDPALLNKILRWYFGQMGLFFSIRFLTDALTILRSIVFPNMYTSRGSTWKVNASRRHFEKIETSPTDAQAKHQIQCSPLPGILSRFHLSKPVLSGLWSIREFLYTKATLRLHLKSLFTLKAHPSILDVASTVLSLGLSIYSVWAPNPWYLTNFFGFVFCYGSLQFMSPTTFWTGTLILSSLFFYDIYFVFFTPLMVTVATKLDVPIKLLFPRPPAPDAPEDAISLAMLGLGDIVIPGMVIGLALRFDLYMNYLRKQIPTGTPPKKTTTKLPYRPATGQWGERFWTHSTPNEIASALTVEKQETSPSATQFTKPYFKASIVGYVLGMMTTLVAMQISEHPQPALLYLVPGVLGSLWSTAFVRGEIKEMWNFTEDEDNTDEKSGDQEGKGNDENVFDSLRSLLGFPTKKAQEVSQKKKDEKAKSGSTKDGDEGDQSAPKEAQNKVKDGDDVKGGGKRKDTSRELIGFSIRLPKKKESASDSEDAKGKTAMNGTNSNDQATSHQNSSEEQQQIDGPTVASTTSISMHGERGEAVSKRTRIA